MKHSEFKIGLEFWMSGSKWRCTDIGTRTIIAIKANMFDDSFDEERPPYSVAEHVLDEYDLPACAINREDSNG